MNVLHIASGDLWAGAEVQTFTLVKALHAIEGVNVSVVLFNHGKLEDELAGQGIAVQVIDENTCNGLQILLRLLKVVRSTRPDVIHTHRMKENILGSACALLGGRIPSVRTVHGEIEYELEWWQLPKRLVLYLNRLSGKYIQQRIIAVSEQLAGLLAGSYPAKRIRVIENGVDLSAIPAGAGSRGARDTRAPGSRIGFAGRLVPVKRVDLILETARETKRLSPELEISFHIYGDGPDRQALEQLAGEIGVQDQVRFHGHCDNIHDVLGELDIILLTSDYEGLPMILMEAISRRVAVVSHAVGGIPKLLDNGNCGVLVTDHSPEGYASAVLGLASDTDLRDDLANRAFERLGSLYSAERNANNVLEEYRAICS